MPVRMRLVLLVVLALILALAGCATPAPAPAAPPPTTAPPSPAPALAPSPTAVTVPPSPTPVQAAATPKPSPKPVSPKPSPTPTVDVQQIKRQLESDVRAVYDLVHTFTGGMFRIYSPTPEQKDKVKWTGAHHIEFSLGGRLYFVSLSADYVDSAQKRIEAAYLLTTKWQASTGATANTTDESYILAVSAELQKAQADLMTQQVMSAVVEKAQVEAVRTKDDPLLKQRTFTEEEVKYTIGSMTASYERYRKDLREITSKLSSILSYCRRVPAGTPAR